MSDKPLRWYQGLDRYCWIVLIIYMRIKDSKKHYHNRTTEYY